jgi:hypothetical protein
MKTRVTNTINGDVQVFDNLELANAHVKSEITWFNSPNENKNGNGYDESDFIVEQVRYVICDKTANTGKPYIAEDLTNTGDYDSAWIFNSKEEADKVIEASNWDWAYTEEI